jgi:hypothetical protein
MPSSNNKRDSLVIAQIQASCMAFINFYVSCNVS